MTTYRLMDGLSGRPGNGPSSVTSYSGPFLAGVSFSVAGKVMWLDGYFWWVCPTGQSTAAQKFALWNRYGTGSSQSVVPGSVVTSGPLTAGQWNFIALATPIQLAPGTLYVASTGWTTSTGGATGFPDLQNQFGSGQPYASGIVNGPLTAWSDLGASNEFPASSLNYGLDQGLFSVAGTDPSASMPNGGSNSANFWMDLQVDTDAPPGFNGSYRLRPNKVDLGNFTLDTANNFTLGLEISLSQASTLDAIWFYSPATVTQLPTECAIYDVTSQAIVTGTHNASPSWTLPGGGAAAAGDGWMYTLMPGSVQLAASTNYKVAVFNGAASPAIWNAAVASEWSTGVGANGLTSGPISAPNDSSATSPGQASYHQGSTIAFPDTHAGPFDYGLDVEVTPATSTPVSGSETSSGTDAGTVAASVPGADTAGGAEGTPGVGFTGPDAGSGADAGTPAAALAGADTGTGAETSAIGLAGPDTGSGADAGSIAVAAAGTETGTGTDSGAPGASVPGADTGAGSDDGSVVIPGSVPELRAGLLGGTASNANLYAGSAQ